MRTASILLLMSAAACLDEQAGEIGRSSAASSPVAWTDVVGVSAAVGGLSKTAPETAWNAGAASIQALGGDGYVEFTSAENTTDKGIGLSVGNGSATMSDIDFAIRLRANGAAMVYEGGVGVMAIGTYAPGVVFRVQAEDGVVTYWRNGVLKYTSALAPTFPLLVDASLRTPGATLTNVRIEPIDFWTSAVGVTVSGRDITKTAAEDQFNAGAASLGSIESGDGYVEFQVADETSTVAAGLSHGNNNQSRTDIDFAIQPNDAGTIAIYEGGGFIGTFGPYHGGDRFRVQVEGGVVTYYRNRLLLHTSVRTPTYPLLLDASIRTPGASILGGKVVAGYVTSDCSPYQETLSDSAAEPIALAAEADVMVAGDALASPPLAHVYRQTPGGWMLEQSLAKPAAPPQTAWGRGLNTDGVTIAVLGGAIYQQPGYVQLHRHDGIQWVRDGRIEPCPDGDDDGLTSFAVLGDVLVVREATPHRLRIYRRVGGSWMLDGLITPPTSHGFGTVALGGNRLFVNLAGPDEPEGAVLVYRHNPNLADPPPTDPCGTPGPGKWRQKGLFTLEPGHRVSGVVASRAGTRLLVRDAYVEDVHVIEQEGTDWVDVARLTRSPFDPSFGAFPQFGGPGGDSFAVLGGSATWVFARTDDGWTQVSYSNYPSRLVDATEDTVFSVDYVADDIKVHGIDPLCAAE